ncbi:hypothetical protein L873DRAFT_1810447 [Choiromyces venosus 120613-1]|uniref:Extracellular membrane protein CFEM domain-containing protein n=1 Tax=Choiromyces venosus 120613-1 TaxID=1336337 RepID=A0A3N4JI73_9PEZI|nr:hypothetical protein L873DRAFT_1810447 [Choiromyces venosus 120613-1]
MKLIHHYHQLLTSFPLLLLLLPILLSITPTTAQEACVKSCTQHSGINQCRGDIPHDQAAWDVLDASIHDCYCLSAVRFAGCRPNCTLDGLPSNIVGRVMGVWEFVNPVCKDAVDEFSKAAESKGVKTGSPEFTAALAEAFHTNVSSSVVAAATGTPSAGNMTVTSTGIAQVTPPPTVLPSSTPTTQPSTNNEAQTRTIAISASLSTSFLLATVFIFWSWARRKRHMLSDQESPLGGGVNSGGLPGDHRIIEDPKAQGIKRWVAEQERIKQLGIKMDPDAASETTSTAYTMWTDTDLATTEVGERELSPIREEDIYSEVGAESSLGTRVMSTKGVV